MRTLTLASALTAAALLAGCGGGDEEAESEPTIPDAVETCEPSAETLGADAIRLASDESSVSLNADTASLEGQLLGITVVGCLVDELGGPGTLAERVGATNALAGPQREVWSGYICNWSFSGSDNRLLFTIDAAS